MENYHDFEVVIGLEVHCQLQTKSKLFCSCSAAFVREPNKNTCEVCLGLPGSLPVINKEAINLGLKLAIAVEGEIQFHSIFARKQYFYPDLPKGYQISQFEKPYCLNGRVRLDSGKIIKIKRIHFEEDAGKSVHREGASLIDLNRAGVPLTEIVSEPDLSSSSEASEYLKKIHRLVKHLGISDGNMEEGSFRCDANVSVRKKGQSDLGTRCEIKNLNSFKFLEKAIDFEFKRQVDLIVDGGKVDQQTMQFDSESGRTISMRSKEDSHDYRYFPDPDLRPLILSSERVSSIRNTMPLLPDALVEQLVGEHQVSNSEAQIIASDVGMTKFYLEVVKNVGPSVAPKLVSQWMTGELLAHKSQGKWDFSSPPLTVSAFSSLMELLGQEVISGKIAKNVLNTMIESGKDPKSIVQEQGLVQVQDPDQVRGVIIEILKSNPSQVQEFHGGKEKVLGFFVGQIMRKSNGRFNPNLVNQVLREELAKLKG